MACGLGVFACKGVLLENQLPEEKLSKLLPALSKLAEHISNGSTLDQRELTAIALEVGVNGEEWALVELQLWSSILEKAQDNPSTTVRTTIITELQDRGIPEFPAVLAYAPVKPKSFSVEPPLVAFRCLKPGEGASATLKVSGGLVKEVVCNRRLKVTLLKTNAGTTLVKVQLTEGNAGETFRDEIILRGDKGELRVPVTVRWEKVQEEPPRLSYCPVCKISKKSLFWNYLDKMYECLNLECKARGPSLDKLVSPYKVYKR